MWSDTIPMYGFAIYATDTSVYVAGVLANDTMNTHIGYKKFDVHGNLIYSYFMPLPPYGSTTIFQQPNMIMARNNSVYLAVTQKRTNEKAIVMKIAEPVSTNTVSTVGIGEEGGRGTTFDIVPNPSDESVEVIFTRPTDEAGKIVIRSLTGQICSEITHATGGGAVVDVRSLAAGVYICQVSCGGAPHQKLLVVRR